MRDTGCKGCRAYHGDLQAEGRRARRVPGRDVESRKTFVFKKKEIKACLHRNRMVRGVKNLLRESKCNDGHKQMKEYEI